MLTMKKIIFFLIVFFNVNNIANADAITDMSAFNGGKIMSAKEREPYEDFYINEYKKYQQTAESPELQKILKSNLYINKRDIHRNSFYMGYFTLGGVDFNIMWDSLKSNQELLNKNFESLNSKEINKKECNNYICVLDPYFTLGFNIGKNAMFDLWLKSNNKKIKDINNSQFLKNHAFLNAKSSDLYINTLLQKSIFYFYNCDNDNECITNYVKRMDLISKMMLLCAKEMKKDGVDKNNNFMKCLTENSNNNSIKRIIVNEGFIEGYTSALRLDKDRKF